MNRKLTFDILYEQHELQSSIFNIDAAEID